MPESAASLLDQALARMDAAEEERDNLRARTQAAESRSQELAERVERLADEFEKRAQLSRTSAERAVREKDNTYRMGRFDTFNEAAEEARSLLLDSGEAR